MYNTYKPRRHTLPFLIYRESYSQTDCFIESHFNLARHVICSTVGSKRP